MLSAESKGQLFIDDHCSIVATSSHLRPKCIYFILKETNILFKIEKTKSNRGE